MIDYILKTAINRRWLVMLLVFMMAIGGVLSFRHLPIDAVPDITNVQVQINTEAAGYSPLETEQRITFIIETALSGLPRLSYTRSLSRYGLSQVTVVFEEGTDLYFARTQVNQRLASIKNMLPQGLEPQMGPIATGLGEIYMYSVEAEPGFKKSDGSEYDATELREVQDWIIKPQLSLVKGVVEINTIGGYNKQYHITPYPDKMLKFGVSFADIKQALTQNNSNIGAGFVENNGQQILVRSPAQLSSITEIGEVVLKTIDAAPIQIKDLAEVMIGKELRTGAATKDGKETVLATAMMLVGENSRAVAQRVAEKLQQIKPSLPSGIVINTVYDRTTLIDKTIATVTTNLFEGALLVMAVLFLLLGNFRAAIITAMIIPLAMLSTISGMVKAGVSANLMSLGALDFGLIVDGAVIIVENAIRRLSQAQSKQLLPLKERLNVVFQATNEVIRPSLFGVTIITVVYIPLFSLGGVEGKMFHPMAATVVMALLSALLLSITFVPAAVALLMNRKLSTKESPIILFSKRIYHRALRLALRFQWSVLIIAISLLTAAGFISTRLGSEFIPELNEGDIALHALRIPGTGIEQAVAMQATLENTILDFPQVETVFSKIGTAEVATDPMPPNVADNFVMLKPRTQWPNPKLPHQQLVEEIEQAVNKIPGNNYEFTQPIQMRFNELISGVRADLGIKVFGDDLEQLLTTADQILSVIKSINGVADARVEQVTGLPMLSIIPKRMALARYGLTAADLQAEVAAAIGGEKSGLIYHGDRRFEIAVRLPESVRRDFKQLKNLPIPLQHNQYVPLSEVATLKLAPAPNQISRENGKRRIVVTANVRNRDLGSFVDEARQKITNQVKLPAGYWLSYGGTFEQLESASHRLSLVVPLTLLLVMVLLVTAFGSLKDALIIFTGVPLALTGGIFALWIRDIPFSISAGVGFIALSGVAVLNGLVMLSFIRNLWQQQGNLNQAIIQGATTRLRPVMMTALVAGLGFIPMALNTATGAEVQRPLATVVIGGIISSTLLTLLILPILYQMIHRKTDIKNKKPTESNSIIIPKKCH